MITLSQCFETAFFLFGKLWPALGAAIVAGGICFTIAGCRALWAACSPRRDREWSDWEG